MSTLGQRLMHVRAHASQRQLAEELGISLRTYQNYERDERLPDAALLARLVKLGWNANWVLTGEGPERGDLLTVRPEGEAISGDASQSMRREDLRLAIQLAEEALDGRHLGPADYAELVTLIWDALVNGLPSAQVLAFARPAARGLKSSEDRDDGKSGLGGSGEDPSPQGGSTRRQRSA